MVIVKSYGLSWTLKEQWILNIESLTKGHAMYSELTQGMVVQKDQTVGLFDFLSQQGKWQIARTRGNDMFIRCSTND